MMPNTVKDEFALVMEMIKKGEIPKPTGIPTGFTKPTLFPLAPFSKKDCMFCDNEAIAEVGWGNTSIRCCSDPLCVERAYNFAESCNTVEKTEFQRIAEPIESILNLKDCPYCGERVVNMLAHLKESESCFHKFTEENFRSLAYLWVHGFELDISYKDGTKQTIKGF
ncbi:MAG: hypothetical protein WC783_00325 [Candidatus Paceibacterota bacterium]|jgi:hypothetical protein